MIDGIPIEVFDEVIRINLRGTWLMCRAAVPVMRRRRWGRIINISSMAGVIGAPRSSPYSASKAGIIGLTRALAMDVAAWGVTVNAICPGALDTSRSVLSVDPDQVTEEARFKEDLDADSLDLVELVMGLEERFDIEVPEDDLEGVTTVGQALDLVLTKVGA